MFPKYSRKRASNAINSQHFVNKQQSIFPKRTYYTVRNDVLGFWNKTMSEKQRKYHARFFYAMLRQELQIKLTLIIWCPYCWEYYGKFKNNLLHFSWPTFNSSSPWYRSTRDCAETFLLPSLWLTARAWERPRNLESSNRRLLSIDFLPSCKS